MKRKIKTVIRWILEANGFSIKRLNSKNKVLSIVEMLRPKSPRTPMIRLGPNNDGGYLVPDDLEGIEALFSPGVAQISMFEMACAQRGMIVHMADASVEGPANTIKGEWTFEKKFLGLADEGIFINMDEWVKRKCPGSTDLLLQMDIEGTEYDVILSMSSQLLLRFRYIVIEFHSLHNLWDPGSSKLYKAFEKLALTHAPVHIHANNCCPIKKRAGIDLPNVLEVTYGRNELIGSSGIVVLPHALDSRNVKSKPDVELSRLWSYSQ